jgi:hypothetical protein
VVVGEVGEADPDGFGDSVEFDEGDSGQAGRDLIAPGAAVSGAGGEDEADLVGFGEPERDSDRDQVARGQDFFAGSWMAPTIEMPTARPWESSRPRALSIRRRRSRSLI